MRGIIFIVCSMLLNFTYAQDSNYAPAANQTNLYLPMLKGKKVGLVVNQTSTIGTTHLVDTLIKVGVQVVTIFAPEHGYRGQADAGEHVNSGIDPITGIQMISLYGDNKKPKAEYIKPLDIVLFDIQDVGVRFYTYISTLHYVMEVCAEHKKTLIVLDRPNPNGFYVDGPVMEKKYMSFIGMHPVPIVYGMTIGEYAQMINGEGWLKNKMMCPLKVIKNQVYHRQDRNIVLPVKPSPNLPNARSIYLYPSLCLLEGTVVSVGRGTDKQFQVFGHPKLKPVNQFSFTPVSKPGAKSPLLMNQLCYGADLCEDTVTFRSNRSFHLKYIQFVVENMQDTPVFLSIGFFEKLVGTASLRKQLEQKMSEKDIRKTWESGLNVFNQKRKKYLLY